MVGTPCSLKPRNQVGRDRKNYQRDNQCHRGQRANVESSQFLHRYSLANGYPSKVRSDVPIELTPNKRLSLASHVAVMQISRLAGSQWWVLDRWSPKMLVIMLS